MRPQPPDPDELDRLAQMLGGEITDTGAIRCPGPNRPDWDRSMIVRFDKRLEAGFVAASLADDDREDCRAVVALARFNRAAAEALEESKRYWAKGGVADRKYPAQPLPPWWPEKPAAAPAAQVVCDLRRTRRQVR
jgi:hypothetical protein